MIGDVLTSSILFEALREKYPDAQLDYLINTHTFPVVENNPFIDNFIFFTKEIEHSKWALLKLAKSVREANYDAVIDVYGKLSSMLITAFSRASIKSAYHKKYVSFLFTHPVKRLKHPKHQASLAIENRFKLLECLHIDFKNIDPKIYLTQKEMKAAQVYLENSGIDLSKPLFMISVLGSNQSKTYPEAYMARVLDHIVKTLGDVQLLFNYIPSQTDAAKNIFELCSSTTQGHIHFDVFGKSLREFLAITKHCHALIGNEGGAVNMAKALAIPTFTIFNPGLNKHNWFGESETKNHVAVHLSDYVAITPETAKKNIEDAYRLFKPEYFTKTLTQFVTTIVT